MLFNIMVNETEQKHNSGTNKTVHSGDSYRNRTFKKKFH